MTSLAVVVPAFKARYFRDALRSLASQTDRDFIVHVGDDRSAENLDAICDEFRDDLRIDYVRFPETRGSVALTSHWNRCVRRSTAEWIWLFSDDDVADPHCVEAFKAAVASDAGAFDVYRYPVGMIDGRSEVTFPLWRYADVQSSLTFAAARLGCAQMSFVVDSVFSRRAFEREGGFVDFPFGWCSDTASWIVFARRTGIRQVSRGGVYWRWSDVNLSSTAAPIRSEKIAASIAFLEWLNDELHAAASTAEERVLVRSRYESWFYHQLFTISPRLRAEELLRYATRLARACGTSRTRTLLRFTRSAARVRLQDMWG